LWGLNDRGFESADWVLFRRRLICEEDWGSAKDLAAMGRDLGGVQQLGQALGLDGLSATKNCDHGRLAATSP
jgi:hypothetical protein